MRVKEETEGDHRGYGKKKKKTFFAERWAAGRGEPRFKSDCTDTHCHKSPVVRHAKMAVGMR